VLLYTFGLSLLTGIIFGSVPALGRTLFVLHRRCVMPGARLRSAGLRSALIVVQVAASFMLLIGGGLTLRNRLQTCSASIRASTTDNLLLHADRSELLEYKENRSRHSGATRRQTAQRCPASTGSPRVARSR
jgi:hypothetical protein